MPRLSPAQKRALLAKEHEQLLAQMRALDRTIAADERKKDTRRKIIAGAIAIEHVQRNPDDAAALKLRALLDEYVEGRDRHLFPFLLAHEAKPAEPQAPDLIAEAAE